MDTTTFIILLVCITISHTNGEDTCEFAYDLCKEFSNFTCDVCIATHKCCVWIYEKDFEGDRCTTLSKVPEAVKKVVEGGPTKAVPEKNEDFSQSSPTSDEPAIQIRPQKVKVKLRKGQPINITLTYKAAPNYALDIYYLMDLTFSMSPHRQQLSTLGNKLAEELQGMTKTYKIAFGYYSDKVQFPYSSMTDKFRTNPCYMIPDTCESGYNFIHAFNFSQDLEQFMQRVNESKATANIDDLEGGFDALMQIILCQKELQWRKHSRKIVIVATDGLLHTAGDGILGGITKRGGETCSLVSKGNFLVYDGMNNDYPSVEEIDRRLTKNKINVLFAVDSKVLKYYKELNDLMAHVSEVALLTDDPDNILTLVKTAYTKLVQHVFFIANNSNDDLKITFFSSCNKPELQKHWNVTSHCNNIKIGSEYVFKVQLELNKLPSDKRKMDKIIIEEMNIEELLEIEVEYIGSTCNCSDEDEAEVIEHGEFECGKYRCHSGWLVNKCRVSNNDCGQVKFPDGKSGEFLCPKFMAKVGKNCSEQCNQNSGRYENKTYTSGTCFNRGEFDSNECKCICDSQYTGKYCQYDQCRRNAKGEICSAHGDCLKGKCLCQAEYTGEICDCLISNETCFAPNHTEICSGHGDCVCGACVCDKTDERAYKGQFCEHCKGCNNLCEQYNEDVIAATDGRKLSKEYFDRYQMNSVDSFDEIDDTTICRVNFYVGDHWCIVTYTYEILITGRIKINHKKDCSTVTDIRMAGGIIFAGVVGAFFILMMAWKSYVTVKDKKEYAKFEEDRRHVSYHEMNPIYKSPLSEFRNPMHNELEK